jgi:hypothetical protein
MRLKKGGKFIAAVIAVLFCTAIIWSSCKKESGLANCNYYVCLNGGRCAMDTTINKPGCVCPIGYEGYNCGTLNVEKYLGKWNMRQVTSGSDSIDFVNDTLYYPVELKKTSSATTFFIYNFSNNPQYTSILCVMDSIDSRTFYIDTMSAKALFYDHYHLVKGSGLIWGGNDSIITAYLFTKHMSPTSNWIRDTFQLQMTR